ncbi:MAG: acyl-CoA desaturase [Actinomycetota bacterium]|nr:acyl-CoA desaturase [Actinomycetota bacterium]
MVTPGDVQPVAHPTRDRVILTIITALPMVALVVAGWQLWEQALHVSDLIVFAIVYALTGLGITVGFHRHLTHRAFKAKTPVRAALAILGSAAVEGPVISWVADHRKHHAFSDEEGDPHSPHVAPDGRVRSALRGLAHAHLGWLYDHSARGLKTRYAPDLLKDPLIRFVDRTFVVWVLAGLAVPFGLGWAIGGSLHSALTGLLWGGLVRMFFLHHVTYSINSLCHFFGRRAYDTGDHSRNLAWLAPLSFGESWHNNHHAFPTSARHGLGRWQIDISAGVISLLEKLGLVWDVVQPRRPDRYAAATEG